MKKITYILILLVAVVSFNSCNERDILGTSDINYINFQTDNAFGIDPLDGENTIEFNVYTTQVSGSDRTYTLNVVAGGTSANAAGYTVPTSVTVPAGSNVGTFEVTIEASNIDTELEIEIVPVTGLFIGNTISLDIYGICSLNEVFLIMSLDDWPEETTWEVLDSGDNVVASGGPYSSSSIVESICLADGTYTLWLYDVYGDGTGPISMELNGVEFFSVGEYEWGSSTSTTFTVPLVL